MKFGFIALNEFESKRIILPMYMQLVAKETETFVELNTLGFGLTRCFLISQLFKRRRENTLRSNY